MLPSPLSSQPLPKKHLAGLGDFAGVPATGRLVTISGIHIHRVRPGRLIEHWEELNLPRVLRQLGVLS